MVCHVVAENWTHILCKSSKRSPLMNHLSSPSSVFKTVWVHPDHELTLKSYRKHVLPLQGTYLKRHTVSTKFPQRQLGHLSTFQVGDKDRYNSTKTPCPVCLSHSQLTHWWTITQGWERKGGKETQKFQPTSKEQLKSEPIHLPQAHV